VDFGVILNLLTISSTKEVKNMWTLSQHKYAASEAGKLARKKYLESEKGKLMLQRCGERKKAKLQILKQEKTVVKRQENEQKTVKEKASKTPKTLLINKSI
jgi:hypothetical protein